MHYYTHNIGEFAAQTRFMSPEEIGIYVILKDEYFANGMRIACDRIANLMPPECEESLRRVLKRFFVEEDGFYVSAAFDAELAAYKDKGSINSENAKKRWAKRRAEQDSQESACTPNATVCDSHATRTTSLANECLTNNHKPITINQEPIDKSANALSAPAQAQAPARKRKTSSMCSVDRPEDCPAQVWSDWMQIRKAKRLPLTQTAWDAMCVEAEKVGYTPAEAVLHAVERGWASFKAQWLLNERAEDKKKPADDIPPLGERTIADYAMWLPEERRHEVLGL